MAELGIDITAATPSVLTSHAAQTSDVVITPWAVVTAAPTFPASPTATGNSTTPPLNHSNRGRPTHPRRNIRQGPRSHRRTAIYPNNDRPVRPRGSSQPGRNEHLGRIQRFDLRAGDRHRYHLGAPLVGRASASGMNNIRATA